ncbi:MAG: hypothetical protein P8178_14010 [Candidatus Thiodiazotropha sp.]
MDVRQFRAMCRRVGFARTLRPIDNCQAGEQCSGADPDLSKPFALFAQQPWRAHETGYLPIQMEKRTGPRIMPAIDPEAEVSAFRDSPWLRIFMKSGSLDPVPPCSQPNLPEYQYPLKSSVGGLPANDGAVRRNADT